MVCKVYVGLEEKRKQRWILDDLSQTVRSLTGTTNRICRLMQGLFTATAVDLGAAVEI